MKYGLPTSTTAMAIRKTLSLSSLKWKCSGGWKNILNEDGMDTTIMGEEFSVKGELFVERSEIKMNEIIAILMRRDGVSYEEAKEMYEECKAELMDAIDGTSCLEPEDVLMSELGLEMDYIFCFI